MVFGFIPISDPRLFAHPQGDDKKSEDREKDDRELPPADTHLGDEHGGICFILGNPLGNPYGMGPPVEFA